MSDFYIDDLKGISLDTRCFIKKIPQFSVKYRQNNISHTYVSLHKFRLATCSACITCKQPFFKFCIPLAWWWSWQPKLV